jgi:hypothetical protein
MKSKINSISNPIPSAELCVMREPLCLCWRCARPDEEKWSFPKLGARAALSFGGSPEYIIGIWCVCVILILMWPFRSYIFVRLPSGRAQSVIKFGCMAARYERAGCVDLLGALSSHLYAENKINCFCYASWKMYTPSECVCVYIKMFVGVWDIAWHNTICLIWLYMATVKNYLSNWML